MVRFDWFLAKKQSGREATTGNASAVCRLGVDLIRKLKLKWVVQYYE